MASLCPEYVNQRSVNTLRPSIMETQGAMQDQFSIMVLSTAFLGKYAYDMS